MKELFVKIILLACLILGVFFIAKIFSPSDYSPDYPEGIDCDRTGCW